MVNFLQTFRPPKILRVPNDAKGSHLIFPSHFTGTSKTIYGKMSFLVLFSKLQSFHQSPLFRSVDFHSRENLICSFKFAMKPFVILDTLCLFLKQGAKAGCLLYNEMMIF